MPCKNPCHVPVWEVHNFLTMGSDITSSPIFDGISEGGKLVFNYTERISSIKNSLLPLVVSPTFKVLRSVRLIFTNAMDNNISDTKYGYIRLNNSKRTWTCVMYFRSSDISDNKAYWNKFPSRFDPYVQWFKQKVKISSFAKHLCHWDPGKMTPKTRG